MKVRVDEGIVASMEKLLRDCACSERENDGRSREHELRSIFQPAQHAVWRELECMLEDFRAKRNLGTSRFPRFVVKFWIFLIGAFYP